jgi:hypothetical protein
MDFAAITLRRNGAGFVSYFERHSSGWVGRRKRAANLWLRPEINNGKDCPMTLSGPSAREQAPAPSPASANVRLPGRSVIATDEAFLHEFGGALQCALSAHAGGLNRTGTAWMMPHTFASSS